MNHIFDFVSPKRTSSSKRFRPWRTTFLWALGHGTIPDFNNIHGCDSRGVNFGWSQWLSWLQNNSAVDIKWEAPSTWQRVNTLVQVSNTVTPTTIATLSVPYIAMRSRNSKDYPSGSYPLGAGQWAYDRTIGIRASGNYQNNTGANQTITLQAYLGATLMWQGTATLAATGASYGSWRFDGAMTEMGSASEAFDGRLTFGAAGTASTTAGVIATELIGHSDGLAVSLLADQSLTIVATLGVASTNLTFNMESFVPTLY